VCIAIDRDVALFLRHRRPDGIGGTIWARYYIWILGLRRGAGMATLINPFIWANKGGIVRLEATGVAVGTDNVTFSFQPHGFLNYPYSGLILFKLPSYTAPTTAVPVIFSTNGRT